MRRTRLRMLCAVTVEKCMKMRQIGFAITVRRHFGLFEGDIGRLGRDPHGRKGPGVQLVGQLVTQRVVLDGGHVMLRAISLQILHCFRKSNGFPMIFNTLIECNRIPPLFLTAYPGFGHCCCTRRAASCGRLCQMQLANGHATAGCYSILRFLCGSLVERRVRTKGEAASFDSNQTQSAVAQKKGAPHRARPS